METKDESAAKVEGPDSVRAKMRAMTVKPSHSPESAEIMLMAVFEKDGPNAQWARYTPCGQVLLTIDNPPAARFFKQGRLYYVDFVECPEEEQV